MTLRRESRRRFVAIVVGATSLAVLSSTFGAHADLLADITVDAAAVGSQIQSDVFGANMSVGFDVTNPSGQGALLAGVGIKVIRWPGGVPSDLYHWQTNTWSQNACGFFGPGPITDPPSNSSFDSFMQNFVIPNHFDVAITLNYGTNATCDGPADPNEAIAWVDYANNQRKYGIRYWSVGNEVYFTGSEPDLHALPHDAATYANEVATQIYPGIKAMDPTAQVGVVVTGIQGPSDWDPTVLQNAMYDFVELHFYPETPGQEDDTFLLTQAPQQLAQSLSRVQQELVAVGKPDTPIMVGEFNSVSNDPGKQSVSIVNGLYMGMALSEILRAGVRVATMQEGFTSCGVGNQSPTLYGWQNFGSYNLFSEGLPTQRAVPGCPNAQATPFGTPFPNARAYQLVSLFAHPSEHMLGTSLASLANIRAYAATQGSGYALFLFNLDGNNPVTVSVAIGNQPSMSFGGQAFVYDKAIYDVSQYGIWAGPSSSSLGTLTNPFQLTLTPWSMSVVQLTPLPQSSLSVVRTGGGNGDVASNPAGITCGTTCSANFAGGTSVTLTATSDSSSTFTSWGGCDSVVGAQCTIVPAGAKTVTATFQPITDFVRLAVTKAGTGSGRVTSPTGISCGGICSQVVNKGTVLTLTATPDPGSTFSGWSGGGNCSDTNTCVVTLTADTAVAATFTAPAGQMALTVASRGSASGTVTSNPSGIACGTSCAKLYASGTSVTLTASAGAGASFKGWVGGGCSGTGACIVAMTAMRSVVAIFSAAFTDPNATAAASIVRAVDIAELRAAVNTLRAQNVGLASVTFTDPTIGVGTTVVQAVHFTELRTAVGTTCVQAGVAPPDYTDPTLTTGVTVIRAVDLNELRSAVLTLE